MRRYSVSFWFRGNGSRDQVDVTADDPKMAAALASEKLRLRAGETLSDMLAIVYEGKRAAGTKFTFDGLRVVEGAGRWG